MGKKTNDPLFNLADALAGDVAAASDEDLLREVAEDCADPLALARTFDNLISESEDRSSGDKDQTARIVAFRQGAGPKQYGLLDLAKPSGERQGRLKFASTGAGRRGRFAVPQWAQIAAALVLGVGIGVAGDSALQRESEPVASAGIGVAANSALQRENAPVAANSAYQRESNADWRVAIAAYQSLTPKDISPEASIRLLNEPSTAKRKDDHGGAVRLQRQGGAEYSKIAAISRQLGLPIRPESLQVPRLEFKGAQLMEFDNRPLARFDYRDAEGNPISFSIFQTGEADSALQSARYEGLDALSWNKGGYGFLIIGTAPLAELRRAAMILKTQVQAD